MDYSKAEMMDAIKEHLAEQGRRLTNLKTASKEFLMEKINEYGIDIETYSRERKEKFKREKKERAVKKKQDEIENQIAAEQHQKNLSEIENKSARLKDLTIYKLRKSLCHEIRDGAVKEDNNQENEENRKFTDRMEARFKKDGANVTREGPNRLCVNGVNTIYGIWNEPRTAQFYINRYSGIGRYDLLKPLNILGILDILLKDHDAFIKGRGEWLEKLRTTREHKKKMEDVKEYYSTTIRCDTWGIEQDLRIMHKDVLEFIVKELTPEQILKINEFQLNNHPFPY